ncbi:MAG: hypothetical protein GSR84_03010 [Desulfurococcales archaeon]|nr:hypothetical protein [Desulfurococcales archaeon]
MPSHVVVAAVFIAMTVALATFLPHQLQGAEALKTHDTVVLERVAALNQTHSIYYVVKGCVDAVSINTSYGVYCAGDLVVMEDLEAAKYLP